MFHSTFRLSRRSLNDRPIGLGHGPLFQLLGDSLSRTHVFDDGDCARHGSIEPMGDSQINLPWLFVPDFQKVFRPELKTVDPGWPLSQQSAGFVHHKHGAFFEQNIRFGRQVRGLEMEWLKTTESTAAKAEVTNVSGLNVYGCSTSVGKNQRDGYAVITRFPSRISLTFSSDG